MNRNIDKYLNRYAEPEIELLHDIPNNCFQHCLVIPCYNESVDLIKKLERSFQKEKNVLIILIINQPEDTPEVEQNLQLLSYFSDCFSVLWSRNYLKLYSSTSPKINWLVVNRSTPDNQIPIKQGVGLARKIGCDIGVALYKKKLLSSTWIHCTDADTHLPENYFKLPQTAEGEPRYGAAVYNFKHICKTSDGGAAILAATQLYENALQYYVDGLTWAGSPYSMHTIGSTLAYSVHAYAEVRGFPKRSAGEDFYLLNKLRKWGPIYEAKDITLHIEARVSNRVPFGTGPAVDKILQLKNPSAEYCYYSPKTFIDLKQWLNCIPNIWTQLQENKDPLEHLPKSLQQALQSAQIHKILQHIERQIKSEAACQKALHDWFDAFQTLKLIRRLQEHNYPAIPLQQCLLEAPFSH